ncbi:bifunctional ADP-dependent NAD(P)H-hydrate dehydratase/NAD(P)H-hydrate epimerase [Oceanicaulis alexandrii]|uniref:bifunctional ADP-dependent NAD(P)H-hydrate dehydratase/NAD(P)H-hydrate epimerase n=1 Tax=Oceanicaulis alexandrii TaxID=153233 RepID=UPI0003B4A73D|nr:bifunctional ADP-dependent NAD(P)H-hydrate dehydratase/NAD(P)H-hydrate epimerase [Oceanicaulis alexandrii]
MSDHPHAILSVSAMGRADSHAVSQGVSGSVLMQNAGEAVARAIRQNWSPRPAAVLCGPGNNGGDGWVIAQCLSKAGWPVSIFTLADVSDLKGDAAWAAKGWNGPVRPLGACQLDDYALIVDALFGAGRNRPLEGDAARLAQDSQSFGGVCVAVDTPSGLSGDMAALQGPVFRADLTVTFHRYKPAHLLSPGRALCGELIVSGIGIPDGWSEAAAPCATVNHPDLWRVPGARLDRDAHKHSRGRLCVLAGGRGATGAARLAARAGQIGGAGFVTVLSGQGALNEIASASDSLVARRYEAEQPFGEVLEQHRASAVVMGPGAGISARLKAQVRSACAFKAPLVLDADALSVFEDAPDALFEGLHADCVLTPHGGEFARLFPDLTEAKHAGNKIERTREAARRCGAVVVFKGADTVIATPDGEAWVNVHASARLATAGTGDVLAGLIGAFLAQGAPTHEAACAAVYIHGDAGRRLGPGGTVDTVLTCLPQALDAVSQAQIRKAALQRLNPHMV